MKNKKCSKYPECPDYPYRCEMDFCYGSKLALKEYKKKHKKNKNKTNQMEKIYPKGINTFAKSEKAPDFVLGTMVINLNTFKEWINGEGKQYLTDYKGSPQIRLQVLQGKERLNIQVDTWKPKENNTKPPAKDDFPAQSDYGDLHF